MKIPFRQGLVSFYRVGSTPLYLMPSATAGYVDFNVSPEPTLAAFAHGSSDYLQVFDRDVEAAWGPIAGESYLYWEIDQLSANVLYRITTLQPVSGAVAPVSPQPDQHWFDTTTTTMKVWNGTKWNTKVAVFAGRTSSAALSSLVMYPIGTQVGLNVEGKPGYIMLDSLLRPARTSSGEFLTTQSPVRIKTTSSTSGVLAVPPNAFVPVRASSTIPAFSLVYFTGADTVGLASSNPALTTPQIPIGVVQTGMQANDVGVVTQSGEIQWDQWDWSAHLGKPVYCGFNGEITVTRPNTLLVYRVGFIKNAQTILFQVDAETQPQVYQASDNSIVISAVPPLTSTYSINGMGERIWTIEGQAATAISDGFMTQTHVNELASHGIRLTTAEADILGKAPFNHTHGIPAITGLQDALDTKSNIGHHHDALYLPIDYLCFDTRYALVSHIHTISNISGLQNAFDLKADLTTIWEMTSINGLMAALAAKADLSHTHAIADVVGLQTVLDTKVDDTYIWGISSVNGLAVQLGTKASLVHTHVIADVIDLQTTLDGINFDIANRAAAVHTHIIGDVTGLQTALNEKTDIGHSHVIGDVTNLSSALALKADVAHTHLAGDITDFEEAVEDSMASVLVAGANVSITHDDVANTITVSATPGGGGGTDTTHIFRLVNNTPGDFGGTVFADWTTTRVDLNPTLISWSPSAFEIADPNPTGGLWEITVDAQFSADNALMPQGLSLFAVDLATSLGTVHQGLVDQASIRFTDPNGNGPPNGNAGLGGVFGNKQTARYSFLVSTGPAVSGNNLLAPSVYANSYVASTDLYSVALVVTFKRVGDYA